ncbi:MAG: hypothetical protein EA383_14930 [Spirochaetaceae bacterium]|jgi:hypothetical protein|nr:MAG: hypothetical protein EA383_14930 [Spirochaetaceae bacterium]
MDNTLNVLARKAGFNSALRHFKIVTQYVGLVGRGANLADLLNESLDADRIERHQIKPILSAVLEEKLGYAIRAWNLGSTIEDATSIAQVIDEWSALELVLVYHHPQTGIFVVNPKKLEHFEPIGTMVRDELAVLYVGAASGEDVKASTIEQAADDCVALLEGSKIKGKKAYVSERKARVAARPATTASEPQQAPATSGAETPQAPAAAPTGGGGRQRMTARIPVNVTNELFHNGNVESWKRIIESYKSKYPNFDVLIWYENERINDINALFKWGKVKHGTPIMISVVGEDPKDISKLRRYLFEGASPRFEAFLHGAVDRVLQLF